MRFFLAGIMQGSYTEAILHGQEYRQRLKELLELHIPQARVYDPLAEHTDSLTYDDTTGRSVFFRHNAMCREVDVLVAFVPQASMGTAIEMWEAYQHGAAVIAVSPMVHNWTIKFLAHEIYADLAGLEADLATGRLRRRIEEILRDRCNG